MGTKPALKTGNAKNLLSEALGTYLRVRRRLAEVTSDEMALAINKASSYWRLIESGSAAFPPASAPSLISFFSAKQVHIDFSNLAIFLLAEDIMRKIDSGDEVVLQSCLSFLRNIPDLSDLMEIILRIPAFEGDGRQVRHFEETVIYGAMRDFLETSFLERKLGQPVLSLEGISPSGVAILQQLRGSLLGRKFADES